MEYSRCDSGKRCVIKTSDRFSNKNNMRDNFDSGDCFIFELCGYFLINDNVNFICFSFTL